MSTPTAAYSVRLRVRLPNVPGALGRLSVALGEIGANIVGLHGFEAKGPVLDEDVVVNCSDEAHIEQVRATLVALEGVEVLEFADRTFEMHAGGKIHVLATVPIVDRDDLSMAYTPGVARVCTAIATDPVRAHHLTIKKNTVAIDRSSRLFSGIFERTSILPPSCMRKVRSRTLCTVTPSRDSRIVRMRRT